ncbi:MAG: hypothetical protein LBR81_03885 [Prevotellaceae bacterium]|jgi:hypothetical protein|nr:hypothetical protein [Prevotellaceae bacterium]
MKKLARMMLTLFSAVVLLTGCNGDDSMPIIAPMTGAWQCTGVSGGALNGALSTPELENQALNLLSVVYGGGMGVGGYARTGSGEISTDVSSVTGLLSGGSEDIASSWSDYLSAGTFTYSGNTTDGVIIMTSKTGLEQEYSYHIEGSTMTLTEDKTPTGVTNALGTVSNILGSLFGQSSVSVLHVTYTYEKASITEIINLMK